MKVALYARVSKLNGHQDPEVQLLQLRQYCKDRKWTVTQEYVDHGVSGAKARRPERDRLITDAKNHTFESVLVWKLDRWGRSLMDLHQTVADLQALGIGFLSMMDNLNFDTAMGKLSFAILAAFAAFERDIIKERVKAGLAMARAKGKVLGPESWKSEPKRRGRRQGSKDTKLRRRKHNLSAEQLAEIQKLLRKGETYRSLAKQFLGNERSFMTIFNLANK